MTTPLLYALAMFRSLFRDEEGQDTFEYVLIIGVVVVAVIVAVASPVGSNLISFVVGKTSTAITGLFS